MDKHGSGMISNSPVGSLCNSILLGAVPGAVASDNATLISELDESSRHVFPSLVILEGFDFRIQLVLSISFERLESLKSVTLLPEEHKSLELGAVINESNPVAETIR